MKKTQHTLSVMVDNASLGECIVVDDLVTCCNSIDELAKISCKACHKMVSLKSKKQLWFNSNNQGENQIITLVKLAQLQRDMDIYWETTTLE